MSPGRGWIGPHEVGAIASPLLPHRYPNFDVPYVGLKMGMEQEPIPAFL